MGSKYPIPSAPTQEIGSGNTPSLGIWTPRVEADAQFALKHTSPSSLSLLGEGTKGARPWQPLIIREQERKRKAFS